MSVSTRAYTTDVLVTPGTYTYRVIVTQNSSGCQVVSANTTVTVVSDPTVSVVASDLTICDGGTSLFTATVSGGTGTTVYQWQSFNGTIWSNVGANQNTYTTPVLTVGTYTYRVLITQASGCDAVSANQVITVVADPAVSVTMLSLPFVLVVQPCLQQTLQVEQVRLYINGNLTPPGLPGLMLVLTRTHTPRPY
jgi:hypothetical protein